MKILHCPTDTGHQAFRLAQAERALGCESDVVVYAKNYLGYASDQVVFKTGQNKFSKLYSAAKFFTYAVHHYDVFHFNGGRSLIDHKYWHIHHWDLPLLKALGKKIFMTYQGCDARQKDITKSRYTHAACHECTQRACGPQFDHWRRKRINIVEHYADHIFVLNPDLLAFVVKATWLPYAGLDLKNIPQRTVSTATDLQPLHILHAPTNQSIKGTHYVVQAVTLLQKQGVPVELHLISGQTHDKVLAKIPTADLVIDQLLIGFYGSFAIEAMAHEIPVMCYLREQDLLQCKISYAGIPIISVTPEQLADKILYYSRNKPLLADIGKQSRHYVEKIHDPLKVAEITTQLYKSSLSSTV